MSDSGISALDAVRSLSEVSFLLRNNEANCQTLQMSLLLVSMRVCNGQRLIAACTKNTYFATLVLFKCVGLSGFQLVWPLASDTDMQVTAINLSLSFHLNVPIVETIFVAPYGRECLLDRAAEVRDLKPLECLRDLKDCFNNSLIPTAPANLTVPVAPSEQQCF